MSLSRYLCLSVNRVKGHTRNDCSVETYRDWLVLFEPDAAYCLIAYVCVCVCVYICSRLSKKKICCSTKLSLIVFLSTRMCVCRLSSMYALQEVSIAFRVWNDATPLSRSDSGNSIIIIIIIIIIICLLTPHHPPSSIHRIRCSSCLYPVGFDLDPRPFRRHRLASNVFACVYVCARTRFLLFVDSVLSNSYRVMKGGSTRTHCRRCRFFLLLSRYTMCSISKPPRSASCLLFAHVSYWA